jgi:hypothetical protein
MRLRIAVPAFLLAGAATVPGAAVPGFAVPGAATPGAATPGAAVPGAAVRASPVCASAGVVLLTLPPQGVGPLCVSYGGPVSCREETVAFENPDLFAAGVYTCLPSA